MGGSTNFRNKRPKKRPRRDTFGGAPWMPLSEEIKSVDAWHALTSTERLVLLEMIRVYDSASYHDTVSIDSKGFNYPWSYCCELVDPQTFYAATRSICRVGWFEERPDLQDVRPAAPKVYTPSDKWRRFKATGEKGERIRKAKARRQQELARGQKRKRDFLAKTPTKRRRSNSQDTTTSNSPDTTE